MKYIAFKGTYNEQIYDGEEKTIKFKNISYFIRNVKIIKKSKTWLKYA